METHEPQSYEQHAIEEYEKAEIERTLKDLHFSESDKIVHRRLNNMGYEYASGVLEKNVPPYHLHPIGEAPVYLLFCYTNNLSIPMTSHLLVPITSHIETNLSLLESEVGFDRALEILDTFRKKADRQVRELLERNGYSYSRIKYDGGIYYDMSIPRVIKDERSQLYHFRKDLEESVTMFDEMYLEKGLKIEEFRKKFKSGFKKNMNEILES